MGVVVVVGGRYEFRSQHCQMHKGDSCCLLLVCVLFFLV